MFAAAFILTVILILLFGKLREFQGKKSHIGQVKMAPMKPTVGTIRIRSAARRIF